MRCTGGVAPWRRDGDKGPSYYAVCPLCDNPIQIVGLFRRQEESRAHRPYGRHHRGDVHPKDQTGRALYGLMRGEFDRVTLAWERFSGIHLGPGAARDMLRNETFRLRGLLGRDDGQQAFDDLTLDIDQDWLPHTADAQPGRDERLLDIARETLQSDAGIPADQ